jgi:uncharacterized protein with HXXEE motif
MAIYLVFSSMILTDTRHWLLWAPLGAAVTHIFEEFVWPGGFMNWYRQYRGLSVSSITPRFLTIVNVVLLAVCVNAALAANTPFGIAYWIAISGILASNGVWHLWAAVRSRVYSPGMVTGLLLYVPLAIYGCTYFLKSGSVSIGGAVMALLIGGSYPLWSAVFHARSRSTV